MASGMSGGSGVGLSDVLSVLKQGVQALTSVAQALKAIFPQSGTTAASATAGTATALPAQPAGYLIVTINGAPFKLPYFNA